MRIAKLLCLPLLALLLSACGVNPVTGKKEIQFVSEAQEIKIGEQHYSPTKQSEGGSFDVLPDLSAYVNEVGQKLAAVADRKLPYEFVVLNNPVPNAWALPGGKIAVNVGLLSELKNEAELAAVLGHEIVHAAARHGAKAQERGTLMQVGLAAAQIGAAISDVDSTVANLAVQGAGLGAQMIQQKYGRDQELESDEYGMKYMKLVGYDPQGAVTLQETFVRLSQQQGGKAQSFLEGLFASHPPSEERVAKNKEHAARLGLGGDVGKDRYDARLKPFRKIEPAYDKFEEAMVAARKKEYPKAQSLVEEAIKIEPREGRFHEFLGEMQLAQKKPEQALPHYQKAIDLNPDYFGSYLGAGVAQYQTGNKARAEEWLTKSVELLPTAPAAYYLGTISKDRGDRGKAMEYFRAAAGSQSQIGQRAANEFVRMDLPQNPGNYVATQGQLDAQGRVVLVVQNRSPAPLAGIQVTPVLVDASGRVTQQGAPVVFNAIVQPGQQAAAQTGIGGLTQAQLPYLRFRVDGAKVAE
ncbi:M48 family metalloprotease [Steroidobacter sp.]|uniref:M48 family metalloprotease n=1 Tax=Steroidobacter sp. TaxID=1978227 RepID=UPI001A4D85F0|nr:M48 family metalloprotease [Steroidobacter sp.]MBL8265023.1 M48 family metalloprotease [Steroidobacter sp.]